MKTRSPLFFGHLLIGTALLTPNLLPAQAICDSIEVVSVSYAAFTDTAMQVVLRHTGNQFLGYPHCWLVDQTADTVARESLNLFGLIGPTLSSHYLYLDSGTAVPATPFTGTVLFRFLGDSDNDCAMPVTTPLCPTECMPLEVFVFPQSGSVTTAAFTWSMRDSTDAVVGTGTLNIDSDVIQDLDTLCLTPGPYTLHVEQPVSAGTGFQVGVMQQAFLSNTPMAVLVAGGSVDLPFNYYPPCFDRRTGVEDRAVAPTAITIWERVLTITHPDQRPLGAVAIFDASGRCVVRASANASTFTMDLSGLAAGVHLVRVGNTGATVQRIVLP